MKRSRKYLDKRAKLGNGMEAVDTATAISLIKSVASDWELSLIHI